MRTEVPSLRPAPRVTFGEAISFREHRLGNDIMHIDEYLVGWMSPSSGLPHSYRLIRSNMCRRTVALNAGERGRSDTSM